MSHVRLIFLMLLPLAALLGAQAGMRQMDVWMSQALGHHIVSATLAASTDEVARVHGTGLVALSADLKRHATSLERSLLERHQAGDAVIHARVLSDGSIGQWNVDQPSGRAEIDDVLMRAVADGPAESSCREKA